MGAGDKNFKGLIKNPILPVREDGIKR